MLKRVTSPTALHRWLRRLEEQTQADLSTHLFDDIVVEQVIAVIRQAGEGPLPAREGDLLDRLAHCIVGLPLRDWSDETEESFCHRLLDVKARIERELQARAEAPEHLIEVTLRVPGQDTQRFQFHNADLSPAGRLLLENLKGTLDIVGRALSPDERRRIAVAFLDYVLNHRRGGPMTVMYLDNAATTYPKPACVYEAADAFYREWGGNAGRGANPLAKRGAQLIAETRAALAEWLGAPAPKRVLFRPSATIALNMVILGADLGRDDVVYVTPFEHNSVLRPVEHLRQTVGVQVREIPFDRQTYACQLERLEAMFWAEPPGVGRRDARQQRLRGDAAGGGDRAPGPGGQPRCRGRCGRRPGGRALPAAASGRPD
ncbi:MAG: aminotransferase class V-fold PLP-dependent enzyme [Ardenticatenia bacterium]|nr:aminotransferase class V-fold PLP-dependent enzyme [Ardenticatenia bacterium]